MYVKFSRCLSVFFLLFSDQVFALSDAELHFALSYAAYLQHDYIACADGFFPLTVEAEPLQSRARVYLAICQYNLKQRSLAAYQTNLIIVDRLTADERLKLSILERHLVHELELERQSHWSVTGYAGTVAFSSTDPIDSSAKYLGLDFTEYWKTWALRAAVENLALTGVANSFSYSQTQIVLGAHLYSPTDEQRVNLLMVSSNNSNYNSIASLEWGYSHWFWDNTQHLNLEVYYTYFPNSMLQSLSVVQGTVSSLQRLWSEGLSWSLWGLLGISEILPMAGQNHEAGSSLNVANNYLRLFTEFDYYQSKLKYFLKCSFGQEMFGLRDDASVFYSSVELHQTGFSLGTLVHIDSHLSLGGSFILENYLKGTSTSNVAASGQVYNLMATYYY